MPNNGIRSNVSSRLLQELRQQWQKLIHVRTYRHVALVEWQFLLQTPIARLATTFVQAVIAVELVAVSLKMFPGVEAPLLAAANFAAGAASGVLLVHHRSLAGANAKYRVLLKQLSDQLDQVRELDTDQDTERSAILAARELCKTFNDASGQPSQGPPRFFADILLLQPDGILKRRFSEPFHLYNPDGVMSASQGAAGLALQTGDLVYVPNVHNRHGIRLHKASNSDPERMPRFELAENVFVPIGTDPPFGSLLCVPFRRSAYAAQGPFIGVACFGAAATGAFSGEFFFDAANIATGFIATAIDKMLSAEERHNPPPTPPGPAV